MRDVIERNVIADHALDGIMVTSFLDKNFWPAQGNIFRNNRIIVVRRTAESWSRPAVPPPIRSAPSHSGCIPVTVTRCRSRNTWRMDCTGP